MRAICAVSTVLSIISYSFFLYLSRCSACERPLRSCATLRRWLDGIGDMSSFGSALVLALHLTVVFGYNYGSLNHDAQPYVVAMFSNESAGPDGMLFSKPLLTNSLTRMDD